MLSNWKSSKSFGEGLNTPLSGLKKIQFSETKEDLYRTALNTQTGSKDPRSDCTFLCSLILDLCRPQKPMFSPMALTDVFRHKLMQCHLRYTGTENLCF